jgi:drug/metabolite transporter (DMT)-like permease
MLLLPITGVLSAMILLGERPDLKVFIGGFVILVGVGIILLGKIEKKS